MQSIDTYQSTTSPLAETRYPRLLEIVLLVVFSIVTAMAVILTGTKPWFVPLVFMTVIYLLLMFFGLEFGTYLLLGTSICFDQFLVGGIKSWYVSKSLRFFQNLNNFPNPIPSQLGGLHTLSQSVMQTLLINPVEFTMLLMVAIFVIRATVSKTVNFRRIPNLGMALLFLVMLIVFTGYGLARPGGDFKVALWEIRPLYYLCLCYFISTQTIRTKRHVHVCVWIIIAGLAFRGLQGCWRFFITLRCDLGDLRAISGHEDSLFLITSFLLLAAFLFLKYRGPEFYVLLLIAPPCFLTFLLNQRRITFGVVGLCMVALVLLLPRKEFLRSLFLVIPATVVITLYTIAFWNGTGLKAMPVQKLKSGFVTVEGAEDSGSNIWRELEILNLKATIRAYPMGIGFGQKFLMVVPYASLEEVFPLWDYIPHCAIYWIWVKTGFIGFIIFWLFFGAAIVRTMIDYRTITSPYYKSLALMVALFIAGQLVVAYYDLQITFFRNMIYLGIAMGMATVLRDLEAETAQQDLEYVNESDT